MIRSAFALRALLSVPASAAERRVSGGSFDRGRVTGPFEVTPGDPLSLRSLRCS